MSENDLIVAWSGGKDSAMALNEILAAGRYNVVSLLTTLTEGFDRISMHGVRNELLDRQAAAIGIPLSKVYIPQKCSDIEYQSRMRDEMERWKQKGVTRVAFADLFLEDVRKYREDNLKALDMECMFPLWLMPTSGLSRRFIALGFKTIITCVDGDALDKSFAGRIYDEKFLDDLPPKADPCGENGEFHSFVFDGPIFKSPVGFEKGDVVKRDGRFFFCDLIPL